MQAAGAREAAQERGEASKVGPVHITAQADVFRPGGTYLTILASLE